VDVADDTDASLGSSGHTSGVVVVTVGTPSTYCIIGGENQ
jgi:hypothetical protein